MKLITLATATLNQTPMDWSDNLKHICAAIHAARQAKAHILCLPELCISGYGCEDAFLGEGLLSQAQKALLQLVQESKGLIVAVGLPLRYQNRIYNTVCLLADNKILGFVAKRYLPSDGIHYEPRWFHPWPKGVHAEIEINGEHYPIGDLYFNCGGIRIGFEICEEAWVANRPGIALAEQGIDVILNPTASHFAFNKQAVRQRLVTEGSRAFSTSYIYANLLGNEAGRVIYDGGSMIASNGQLLAQTPRLSFQDWQLATATVNIDLTRMHQARTSQLTAQKMRCVKTAFDYPAVTYDTTKNCAAPWESQPFIKEEEFSRAVGLGLFDYLRKSRAQGFALSLSGGADSACIASLVRLMIQLACAELGIDGFSQKLAHIHFPLTTVNDISEQLLACLYQATNNSSHTTQNAAKNLATAVHARFYDINIEDIVQAYISKIATVSQHRFSWLKDDLALQNIQARARAPAVWLLANSRNALLLATSNRSEVAVGYATMDGDTSGGLSPIAGVDKPFIRHWLRWLEQHAPDKAQPIAALAAINAQQPTAELRPNQQQTDESDLMPYDILNRIQKAAILERQTPEDILWLLQQQEPQYPIDQLAQWITRFFNLWSQNQWKRERYAPSFHLDDENLDPRSWCRFPILSGGFKAELAAMQAKVKA